MEERVYVFDTTLRDGEQAAGTRLGAREKLAIARQLELLNVDIIEAGFPVSSPAQFEATRLVAEQVQGPTIAGLARAHEKDIEAAARILARYSTARRRVTVRWERDGDEGELEVLPADYDFVRERRL